MPSSDDCVRIEAEGEQINEYGAPFVNRHTPGILTVETTLAPTRDNTNKHPRISNNMIHTDAIIARQMEIFQPLCPPNIKHGHDRRKECELLAIQVLKTGVIPSLTNRESFMLIKFLDEVNKVRRQRNFQEIPQDVFDKKSEKIRTGNVLLTWLTR